MKKFLIVEVDDGQLGRIWEKDTYAAAVELVIGIAFLTEANADVSNVEKDGYWINGGNADIKISIAQTEDEE